MAESTSETAFSGWAQRDVVTSHKKKFYTINWNCRGEKLATGGIDQTIRVWSIQPTASLAKPEKFDVEFKGHTNSVDHLAWHPEQPDQLASSSGDQTVRLWDARTQKAGPSLNTGAANLFLAWSPNGRELVICQRDGGLKIVDSRKMKVQEKQKFDYDVNEICFNSSGNVLFVVMADGSLEVLQYPSMQRVWSIRAHTASCYCLAIDRANRLLATGGADALVGLWDLEDMVCINTFFKIEQPVRSLSFSHDGRFLAYAVEEPVIDIVDTATGDIATQLLCKSPIEVICWNPKKPVLAYTFEDKDSRGDVWSYIGIFAQQTASK